MWVPRSVRPPSSTKTQYHAKEQPMFERIRAFDAPRKLLACVMAYALVLGTMPAYASSHEDKTATPIKHLVVIFQENVSFDHYFGTYPYAKNPKGESPFVARTGTPSVNGLTGALLTANPNYINPANGTAATNPFRLDPSQAGTADQNHSYTPEQAAAHNGLMDLFPLNVGTAGPPPNAPPMVVLTKGLTMGYYDGNTVTAFWNYAQHYAMSDNSYGSNFGPSTPGAINLVAGQTNGVINLVNPSDSVTTTSDGSVTLINDADPTGDMCSTTTGTTVNFSSKNIGDLLNAQ